MGGRGESAEACPPDVEEGPCGIGDLWLEVGAEGQAVLEAVAPTAAQAPWQRGLPSAGTGPAARPPGPWPHSCAAPFPACAAGEASAQADVHTWPHPLEAHPPSCSPFTSAPSWASARGSPSWALLSPSESPPKLIGKASGVRTPPLQPQCPQATLTDTWPGLGGGRGLLGVPPGWSARGPGASVGGAGPRQGKRGLPRPHLGRSPEEEAPEAGALGLGLGGSGSGRTGLGDDQSGVT